MQIPKDPKESKRFKPNMQLAALRKDTIVTDWLGWLKKNRGAPEKKDYLFSQYHKMHPGQYQMDDSCVYLNFKAAVKHANVKGDTTFHKLRDAFKSVMIWAEVDEEVREVMMGHKPTRSKGNYFDNHDLEMVRNWYVRADWSKERKSRITQLENKVNQHEATILTMQNNTTSRELKDLKNKYDELLLMFQKIFGEMPKTI